MLIAAPPTDEQEFLKRLRQTRADYDAERILHTFWIASYTGDGGFRNGQVPAPPAPFWGRQAYEAAFWTLSGVFPVPPILAGPARQTWSFLVPFRDEDQLSYDDRVNASVYTNFVEPVIDLTNAFLMAEDAIRENVPPLISAWSQSVDGFGRNMWQFATQTLLRCQLVGYVFTLVDMPEETGQSLSDSIRMGVMPRLINIWPQDVLDYDLDKYNRLKAIKTISYYQKDRKSILDPRILMERITIWTRDYWEKFDVERMRDDKPQTRPPPPERMSGPNDLGVVPMAMCRWRTPITDTGTIKGHPQIGTLAQLARAFYNRESEHDYNLRSSTFAQMVIPDDGTDKEVLGLGAGNQLAENAECKGITRYIAPPDSVSSAYERRIERITGNFYRTALIDRGDSAHAETAESRKLRFMQTNAMLGAAAANMDQWELDVYALIAMCFRLPYDALEQTRVHRKRQYQINDLDKAIEGAIKSLKLPIGPTALARMTKHVVSMLVPDPGPVDERQMAAEIEEHAKAAVALPQEPVAGPGTPDLPTQGDPTENNLARPLNISPLQNALVQIAK